MVIIDLTLHLYVEEQAFRYNKRYGQDADRFKAVLRGIIGRRVTYKSLTGVLGTA